jgi:hypothetical protein
MMIVIFYFTRDLEVGILLDPSTQDLFVFYVMQGLLLESCTTILDATNDSFMWHSDGFLESGCLYGVFVKHVLWSLILNRQKLDF